MYQHEEGGANERGDDGSALRYRLRLRLIAVKLLVMLLPGDRGHRSAVNS